MNASSSIDIFWIDRYPDQQHQKKYQLPMSINIIPDTVYETLPA